MRPTGDNVLVGLVPENNMTDSGIALPEVRDPRTDTRGQWARVVEIGPGRKNKRGKRLAIDGIAPGDLVFIKRWMGTEFHLAADRKQKAVLISQDDILAVAPPFPRGQA